MHGVGYIGLVASKVRGASILDALELSDAERARVHTPVGLAIGAKTPAEIAVSIAAELIAGIRERRAWTARRRRERRPAAEAVDPVCGMTVTVGPGHRAPAAGRRGLLVLLPGMPHGVRGGRVGA